MGGDLDDCGNVFDLRDDESCYNKGLSESRMFSNSDIINALPGLNEEYDILISNHHDIRIHSHLTSHDWIIISPYDSRSCTILHRHSDRSPFHRQRGQYTSLASALEYIKRHDQWYSSKRSNRNPLVQP